MGKVLEEVLKKELGFGEKRIEKFMSAYMSEVAVTAEVMDVGQEEELNVTSLEPRTPLGKIGRHAMERWVERVYGLALLEANMRLYINEYKEQIELEIRETYAKSIFLLDKIYQPQQGDETLRSYHINGNIMMIMDVPTERMVTLYLVSFNMPAELEIAMVEAVTKTVIKNRIELGELEISIEPILQKHIEKQQELIEEKRLLDEKLTACKAELKESKQAVDKQKARLAEQAKYLIHNKYYSEDDLL